MNAIRTLRLAGYTTLIAAIIASVWFEQYARASASIKVDGYTLWVAAPFAFMGLTFAVGRSFRSLVVLLILSGLLAFSSVLIYWGAMFAHVDAQGGLIFLFLPLCQIVVAALALAVVIIAFFLSRRAANNSFKSDALNKTRA